MMGQLAQEVEADGENLFATGENFSAAIAQPQAFGILAPPEAHDPNLPGTNGERYYTITRVNGSGGNGKADGVPGPHKHTLEESDRVKKSSIQRHFLKEEKEKKKVQVCLSFLEGESEPLEAVTDLEARHSHRYKGPAIVYFTE